MIESRSWGLKKKLLRFLVYKCNDPTAFLSLALTCKYTAGLCKFYSPTKKGQFSQKFTKWYYSGSNVARYVKVLLLPNGAAHGMSKESFVQR